MSRRPNSTAMQRHQRGMVLPLLAIGMLAIVGVVGLSIDVGHAFLNKSRLQNSLDSAALSGARTLMLTDDVVAAGADARDAFGAHLEGEMAGLEAEDLVLQYSDTLIPFVPGGDEPRYVRAAFDSFATGLFFARVLQGVGDSMRIGATAVAGPIPVGYPGVAATCDVAPLMVCGAVGDVDCADGACFGYGRVGERTEYELRFGSGVDTEDTEARTVEASAIQTLSIPACGEGSAYPDCVPAPDSLGGPGNFRVHELGCKGQSENCARERLAGSFDACLTEGARVSLDDVGTPELVVRGLMSRLGVAASLPLSDFPPDVVTTDRTADVDYWYDRYRDDVASRIAAGSTDAGVPYRRVLTVPVVTCADGAVGSEANTLLGFLCLFLTRVVDASEPGGTIYGQFVRRCEASGEQGASVPAMSDAYDGPVEIVLYRDPASLDS